MTRDLFGLHGDGWLTFLEYRDQGQQNQYHGKGRKYDDFFPLFGGWHS
jgi:hypothetical protein